MFTSCSDASVPFEKYRIIIPSISIGNVGQLTVDLLVNTLQLPRVGYLNDPAILPLVGNDAFDHTQPSGYLHTSAEVYASSELQLAVVQFRAPLAKGCWNSFCSRLLDWIKEEGFSEVVLLSSSHAHERRDSQIRGQPFRFLLNNGASELYDHFTDHLKWTSLEPRPDEVEHEDEPASPSSSPAGVLDQQQLFLPGSGITKKLYSLSSSSNVRMVVLIVFCSQGDNIQDAVSLTEHLDQWISVKQYLKHRDKAGTQLLYPSSWSLMYGGPSPIDLF